MLVPTFAGRGCHVIGVTDPYGRILGFLDRSRYFFFQVTPQLYSRGWVDPVPDRLLVRKSGSAGIEPGPLDLYPATLTTRPQRRSAGREWCPEINVFVTKYSTAFATSTWCSEIWTVERSLYHLTLVLVWFLPVTVAARPKRRNVSACTAQT
jgi:hypothetical protein